MRSPSGGCTSPGTPATARPAVPAPRPAASLPGALLPRRRCFNARVTDYDVLRVFCAPNGGYGNELGVVRDGSVLPERSDRQELAAKLGFSETVFVDDSERGVIDIYTPTLR